jgi:hypothetical protein
MSGLVWGGGAALAPVIIGLFRVWWTNRIHRENVDRVCTSMERLARAGHPVADAGEALRAVRPLGHIQQWMSRSSRDPTPDRVDGGRCGRSGVAP